MRRHRFGSYFFGSVFAMFVMAFAPLNESRATLVESFKKIYSSPTAEQTEKCVDVIDLLNGITREASCPVTPAAPVKVAKPVQEFDPPSLKSEGDLLRYLECYAIEEGRYAKIAKTYMPLISAAAREFELPKAFLACLIFRESRFDPNAVSPSGAMNLGQHMPETTVEITTTIQVPKPLEGDRAEQRKKFLERLAQIDRGEGKPETAEERKGRKFLSTKEDLRILRTHWENYFDDLQSRRLVPDKRRGIAEKNKQEARRRASDKADGKNKKPFSEKPVEVNDGVPRVVDPNTLQNPAIAIGATALYLKSILMHFQKRLDQDLRVDHRDDRRPNVDLLLAVAGAYNRGPGKAVEVLAPIEPPDRKKWVEALMRSKEETAGYILSIRNCIEPATSPRGNAWKAPIRSANYNCKGDLSDKRVPLPGGVNEIPPLYGGPMPKPAAPVKPVKRASPARQISTSESPREEQIIVKPPTKKKPATKAKAPATDEKK